MFDDIVIAVQQCAGTYENAENVSVFQTFSLALRMGHSPLKCSQIKKGLGIRAENDKMEKDENGFKQLFSVEWTDRISSPALTNLKTNHFNTPSQLPQTKDLILLKEYVTSNIEQLISTIRIKGYTYTVWRELAVCTMT